MVVATVSASASSLEFSASSRVLSTLNVLSKSRAATLPPLSVAFIKLLPADAGAEGAALRC